MTESEAAKTLFFEALALMDSLDFPGAELRLREAQRLAPQNASVLTNLALALIQQDKRTQAREFAEQALAINAGSVQALLVLADCHVHDDDPGAALAADDRIVALDPGIAEVHTNRGNALHSLGRHDDALVAYDRALALAPELAEAWLGRGNVLGKLRRFDELFVAYDKALALKPDLAEAWLGRGNALCDLKRHEEALTAHDKALALNPRLAMAWLGRGNVFHDRKRYADALGAYDKAVALNSRLANAWIGRGDALRYLKRIPESVDAYRRALALGANAKSTEYYLAALGAATAPPAMPEGVVVNLFDNYADNFEVDLVGNLRYQAHARLAEAITQAALSDQLDILDMGCGTGLLGERLQPVARTLVGIDLSEKMLDKARRRGIYDRLVCGDLAKVLQGETGSFDVAVATDVFIYIGELSPIFREVQRLLRPQGLFGFSIESTDDGDFVLRNTLRYAQSLGYVRKLADRHRFSVKTVEPLAIRREGDVDIMGHTVVLRRA